jgi:hypothetical protein
VSLIYNERAISNQVISCHPVPILILHIKKNEARLNDWMPSSRLMGTTISVVNRSLTGKVRRGRT